MRQEGPRVAGWRGAAPPWQAGAGGKRRPGLGLSAAARWPRSPEGPSLGFSPAPRRPLFWVSSPQGDDLPRGDARVGAGARSRLHGLCPRAPRESGDGAAREPAPLATPGPSAETGRGWASLSAGRGPPHCTPPSGGSASAVPRGSGRSEPLAPGLLTHSTDKDTDLGEGAHGPHVAGR